MTNLAVAIAVFWYWECAGEPIEGRRAVQDVTWTRCVERSWKAKREINEMDIFHVLVAPKQFSAVHTVLNKPAGAGMPNDKIFHELLIMAEHMIHCAKTGESDRWKVKGRYTHYWNHNQVNPAWARDAKDKTIIGNHTFARL